MANISFKGAKDYGMKLQAIESYFKSDKPIEEAVAAGAAVVADEIRKNIEALPEEDWHRLQGHEGSKFFMGPPQVFLAVPHTHKEALKDGFGISPVQRDKHGAINVKLGFDGYADEVTKSKAYPNGLPTALIARAVESGSSVRAKHPFIRPAVNSKRQEAIEAMDEVIEKKFAVIQGAMMAEWLGDE